MEKLQEIPFETYKNEIFRRLGEISKVANLSERERLQYNDYLKWTRDYRSELDYERSEGIAQGRAEGIVQGRAEGILEGRIEEKRELVANFKALGVDLDTISKATGLSIEEIKAV